MYFGMMAKLGPLASRDYCAEVRGMVVRFITHFSLLVVEGAELLGAEGVGGAGVVVVTCVVEALVLLDWLFCCLSAVY